MAQLDTMLRVLAERGARELRLCEGNRPIFRFPDGDRPVSQAVLNRAQILVLAGELSGRDHAARLAAGEPCSFIYRLPDGRGFVCEASPRTGTFAVRPMAAEPGSAPPEAAVPAPGGPPAAPAAVPAPARPERGLDAVEVRPGAPEIERFLVHMVEAGASDLHLSPGEVPMLRLHGEMVKIAGAEILSGERTGRLLEPMMSAKHREEFRQTRDTDFAYEIPGVARFRVNVYEDRLGTGGVFRVIPSRIPTAEELGLPSAILDLCRLTKGLILVTGPTGSGKSTTLAALIDHVNRTRSDHIITIEDPIEFVHANRRCLINQREIGTHTQGFKRALRAALREDPDIVLVGEMRDLETIAIAIETAETGHLVFGTLHTSTAPSTVDRIIDQFPADRQAQIRVMLSESLKAVVSQTLLRKIGGGRVAALEILIGIPAVANLIREGKTFQIPSVMQTGRKHGMQQLNDALLDLVKRKVVSPEEAWLKAVDKASLAASLKAAGYEVPPPGADEPGSRPKNA